jgi:hypothetical protein
MMVAGGKVPAHPGEKQLAGREMPEVWRTAFWEACIVSLLAFARCGTIWHLQSHARQV